jgi:hypothetical protein
MYVFAIVFGAIVIILLGLVSLARGLPSASASQSGTPDARAKCPICRGKLTYAGVTQGDIAVFQCSACDARTGSATAVVLHRSLGDWR